MSEPQLRDTGKSPLPTLMAAWDDRLAWKLFTGRCRYCGIECRGVTCAAHADLPRLELLPVQRSVGTVDEPAGDEAA